ncbi:MAG: HlyD family efflux transporter periplasmic adaptor subunit [Alphaproteobacteria bacterium]|nr:HlyD family efflux transporter periplasmic adaptor subunit [Alphaproteobacteria bacterium]
MTHDPAAVPVLARLVDLEREVRGAGTVEELGFVIANRTRQVLPCDVALFWMPRGNRSVRTVSVSAAPVVDRRAPMVAWFERAVASLRGQAAASSVGIVAPGSLPPDLDEEWREWLPPAALWCPLPAPRGGPIIGGLWLARDGPWTPAEIEIAQRLVDVYGHGLWALGARPNDLVSILLRRRNVALGLVVIGAVLSIPVRQSVVAPAEIVARDPVIVAAPMDGMVATVDVRPYEPIAEGQTVLTLDATVAGNRLEIARKSLDIADSEYALAQQLAFSDAESKGRLTLLRAQRDLRFAEVTHAAGQMERAVVRAPRAGVAVFADPNDWIGHPVSVGERIMSIADPGNVEAEIHLPTGDAIALELGTDVQVMLSDAGLTTLPATLRWASYDAAPVSEGFAAYRLKATLVAPVVAPRIGLKGSARVYGRRTTLFRHLFRRPLSALRQML